MASRTLEMSDIEDYSGPSKDHGEKKGQDALGGANKKMVKATGKTPGPPNANLDRRHAGPFGENFMAAKRSSRPAQKNANTQSSSRARISSAIRFCRKGVDCTSIQGPWIFYPQPRRQRRASKIQSRYPFGCCWSFWGPASYCLGIRNLRPRTCG
jgi:hypothetical protein